MNDDNQQNPESVNGTADVGEGVLGQPSVSSPGQQTTSSQSPNNGSLDSAWSHNAGSQQPGPVIQPAEKSSQFNPQSNFQPMQSQNKGSKKKLIAVGVVVALFLLGGIGGGAYWYMYNNHPDKVLADAMLGSVEDLMDQKPLDVSGEMTFKAAEGASIGGEMPTVALQFNNARSGQNIKFGLAAKVKYEGKDYNLGVEAIGIGTEAAYFKINDLEKTLSSVTRQMPETESFTAQFSPIVKKIDNKWIKVTEKDLEDLGLVDSQKTDKCTKALDSIKISKDDNKKISSAYKKNQFASVTEKMGSEEIDGQKSEHYKLGFDKNKAKAFTKEIIVLESIKPALNECDFKEKDLIDAIDEVSDSLGELRKKDGKIQIETWVNKKTRRPTKLSVNVGDKDVTMDVFMKTKFDAKELSIEKPKDAVEFKALMKDIETLMTGSGTDSLSSPSSALSL